MGNLFYVLDRTRQNLVPAQFLVNTYNGNYVLDPNSESAQNVPIFDLSGNQINNPNPLGYLIAPWGATIDQSIAFGATVQAIMLPSPYFSNNGDFPDGHGFGAALGTMANAYVIGGPQDFQRNYIDYNGDTLVNGSGVAVPAFQSFTSFGLGLATGRSGIPLDLTEIGGGLHNLYFNPNGNHDGIYGNNIANVRSIEAGIDYFRDNASLLSTSVLPDYAQAYLQGKDTLELNPDAFANPSDFVPQDNWVWAVPTIAETYDGKNALELNSNAFDGAPVYRIPSLMENVANAEMQAAQDELTVGRGAAQEAGQLATAAWNNLVGAASSVWNAAGDVASSAWNGVSSVLKDISDSIITPAYGTYNQAVPEAAFGQNEQPTVLPEYAQGYLQGANGLDVNPSAFASPTNYVPPGDPAAPLTPTGVIAQEFEDFDSARLLAEDPGQIYFQGPMGTVVNSTTGWTTGGGGSTQGPDLPAGGGGGGSGDGGGDGEDGGDGDGGKPVVLDLTGNTPWLTAPGRLRGSQGIGR
jgi:hypothetical protein